MAIDPRVTRFELLDVIPKLFNGDRYTQSEFHEIYKGYPEGAWFELVEGIVFETHKRTFHQGRLLANLSWLGVQYEHEINTQRNRNEIEILTRVSVVLDNQNEVHPDFLVRLTSDFGGQSRIIDGYVVGPPDLIIEVATHRKAMDYHLKRDVYRRSGVSEYIVVCEDQSEPVWHAWPDGEQKIPHDGIIRSRVFSGFWIDTVALYANVENEGLGTKVPRTAGGSANR